jgi:hypothetical protein
MDQTEIYIKRNIETAREAMTEKIEQLEKRIHQAVVVPKLAIDEMIGNIDELKGGMEETKSAIDHGLDTITQAAEETIIKIKSTADYIAQVEHDPWIMFGSAILMGYAIGSLNRGALVARRHAYTQVEES